MRVKSLRFIDSSRTSRCTDWKIAPLSPQAAWEQFHFLRRLPVKKRKVVLSTIRPPSEKSPHSRPPANLNVGDILVASNGREALGMASGSPST
jgi:hypothetical protein